MDSRSEKIVVEQSLPMERLDVQVARRAGRTAVDGDDERHLRLRRQREVEPAVEAERVEGRVAVDVRLGLGRRAQALAVALLDGLDADDPPLERRLGPQVHARSPIRTPFRRRAMNGYGPSGASSAPIISE